MDERIAELSRKKRAVEFDLEDVRLQMQVIHARMLLEVAEARDERGKPRYSNEETRRAAVTLRLQEDDEFLDLRSKRRALENDLAEIVLELNGILPPDQRYPTL